MPTLNKTKKETKIILKWGGISLLIIFLFLNFGRFVTFIKENFTPPPAPSASFGRLPPIPFPDQQRENITYSLDTLSGSLPNFPDRIKAYKINVDQPTLLALEKTQDKVAQIGFTGKGTQITQDVYQWVDQNTSLQRTITVNIFSQDFTLFSPYLVIPSLQTLQNSNEQGFQNNAVEVTKTFLLSMSLFPQDIDQEKTKVTLYSIERSMLVPTSKISNAKIARVDFFQKDIDGFPIHYEKGIASTIDLLVGKENNQLKVLEAQYFYKNISENSSTYAIKSSSEAFSELQLGKAYIASKPQNVVEVSIKELFLGYYMGATFQDFLMPVVVFVGENDFIAYISAVRDEWISN